MKTLEGTAGFIEFGPKNTVPVPLVHINEMPEQVRQTYDRAAIDDLASSIILYDEETGKVEFDMYNPLLATHLTYDQTVEYLQQHAKFYGGRCDINSLETDEHGNYTILISGHRRKRAIESIMHEYGLPAGNIAVNVNLRPGITFEEALIAQIRENTHEKVSPAEAAKSIEQLYLYLANETGKKPTRKELAAKTGFSENVIGTALQFQQLPESIRALAQTHGDILPYSTLVKLEPLMRKYGELYDLERSFDNLTEEDRDTYIENRLHITANKIVELRLGAEKIIQYIKNLKTDIEQRIINAQPVLELEAPGTSTSAQLRKSRERLARQALSAIRLVVRSGPENLPPEMVDELEELTQKARGAATPASELQDSFVF